MGQLPQSPKKQSDQKQNQGSASKGQGSMRRSKEMRSPKAAHRSPNVGSEPIAIDTGEVGKARTDPFQSLILQQMHLMQQTQAEMF